MSTKIISALLLTALLSSPSFAVERKGDFTYDDRGELIAVRQAELPAGVERAPRSHQEKMQLLSLEPPAVPALLAPRWVAAKPNRVVESGRRTDEVVVKFVEGFPVRLRNGSLRAAGTSLPEFDALLATRPAAQIERLFPLAERILDENKETGERISGRQLADLNNYYRILFPAPTPNAVALANELLGLEIVETAYLAPEKVLPPGCSDIPPTTPDWEASQFHLDPAPAGIDAEFAWNYHHAGDGYSTYWVIDVEYAWCYEHEDYLPDSSSVLNGITVGPFEGPDHGCSVVGEIVACDNGYGMTGTTSDITLRLMDRDSATSIAAAIAAADAWQLPGEIILIEQQTGGPSGELLPVEWIQACFDAIQTAVANGVIVVEAGANGGVNLDSAVYGGKFNRNVRDSGAILVGAGLPNSHSPEWFTNYGSRIDVHAYGSGIWTTGYGDLWNQSGCAQDYTDDFGGTSGASPIVTGACVSLQGIANQKYGYDLSPAQMRTVLLVGATPQGPPLSQNIGPMPDLADAINAIEPDLYPYAPPGWSFAAVPRATNDATGGSAQLEAPALPGNIASTYWNWMERNNPAAYSGTPGLPDMKLFVNADDYWVCLDANLAPGQWSGCVNKGPNQIKGGRHTILTRSDWADDELESNEWNNDWARQFIWSPLILSEDSPVTRTYGPPRISPGSGPWNNAEGFEGATGGRYWYAFAIMPALASDDFDIYLNTETPMNVPTQGFGAYQAYSTSSGDAIDFVVLDRNTVASGTYWASGVNYSGTGDKTLEFDGDAGTIYGPGTYGPFTIGAGNLVELHDVYMTGSTEYRVHVRVLSGYADFGLSVHDGTSGYHGKFDVIYGGYADNQSGGADEFAIVSPPSNDYYGVTVWKTSSSELDESLIYELVLSEDPNLREIAPVGWYGPIVPRNTTDSTPTYAPLPATLTGNQPTTSFNFATLNEGANMVFAPWQTDLHVDDVAYWLGPGHDLPSGAHDAWMNSTLGLDPYSIVRGGRHHLRTRADALSEVTEFDEVDNDFTEWFVWSPFDLLDEVPVARDAPPPAYPLGSGPYASCDGFRAMKGGPDWTAVAVLPLSLAEDYDIALHDLSSGSKDGFGLEHVYSGFLDGEPDFVMANYNVHAGSGMDFGVINFSGGDPCIVQRADGPFEGVGSLGTNVIGPFTFGPDEVLDLHEVYLYPEVLNGLLTISLHNLAGNVDLGLAIYGPSGSFYDRSQAITSSNATGPGGDEHLLPVQYPAAGYYAIAVYRTSATDVGQANDYRILLSTDVLVGAPEVAPAPTRFALETPRPNPFRGETTLRFDVPNPGGEVKLSVFDVRGRRIAELLNGPQPPGRHLVTWNGAERSGGRAAAGIYFVRMEAGSHRETKRLVRLN